ncbi:MAG: ABC transporter ATP-binding protein [Flavobacteriales bacterium]|nr:ABC transporter ATP-binding protein [Flavobacteriales bacterium]
MLEVSQVSFKYDSKKVLDNINFTANKDSHISLIGESGCGKSTLLKLIYGLLELKQGEIFWNKEKVTGPEDNLIPGHKKMKYLAQNFDLMLFQSVEENVGKFLSYQNIEKKQQRINQLLEMVEMTEYKDVKAKYLSGGQQQRVALARVLSLEPEVLLLDEPFSQIDNFRKNSLRRNLFSYLKEQNILCIVATHDYTDALSFSDQIIVIKEGQILRKDTPENIYSNPSKKYIANLFGDVNEINSKYLGKSFTNQNILIYPNELKISSKKTRLKVLVVENYYKGNNYLAQGIYEDGFVYFESDKKISTGNNVYLTCDKELVTLRVN